MDRSSKRRYLLAATAWSAAVWTLLLVPGSAVPGIQPTWLPEWLATRADLVVHVVLMVPLGFLLWRAWGGLRFPVARTMGAVLAFGCSTEASQLWVRGRSAEFGDLVADLAGGLLGILIARRSLLSSPRFGEKTETAQGPFPPREAPNQSH